MNWKTPSDSLVYKNGASNNDLLGYKLFRRNRNPVTSDWYELTTTTKTWFDDTALTNDCYDYYIRASYNEGEGISNIDSLNCIEVGLFEAVHTGYSVFPNPNEGIFHLRTPGAVKHIEIFNPLGVKIGSFDSPLGEDILIDLHTFQKGIHSLRVTENQGQVVNLTVLVHQSNRWK